MQVKSKSQENQGEQVKFTLAKQRLASNPETRPKVLKKLAKKEDPQVLERVAENPQTSAETLEELSNHESSEVRGAVSENSNTPERTLHSLAGDLDPDVRFRLAENPATPIEILENLAEDENPFVVARAQDTLKSCRGLAGRADDMLLGERFEEAENMYRSLVSGLEELLGKEHPEVSAALHKLAAALSGQGRQEEATVIETRAKAIKSINDDTEQKSS